MMSPWLFSVFMDGCMKEMKAKVRNEGAELRLNGEDQSVITLLFSDDTVLLVESEGDLQRVVNKFCSVCKRRKLKVNTGKSKVMMFVRREEEVIDFYIAYSRGTQLADCSELFCEPQHPPPVSKKS